MTHGTNLLAGGLEQVRSYWNDLDIMACPKSLFESLIYAVDRSGFKRFYLPIRL